MNVDVDDDHVNIHPFRDAGSRSSQYPDSSIVSGAYGRGSDYSMNTSPSRAHGRSPSSHSFHSLPAESNTSTDSMDSHYGHRHGHGHGYGHGHDHSLGHNGRFSNAPMRPHLPQQEAPVKLTPITGRVSRAKKGVPVHTCDICRPPKVPALKYCLKLDSTLQSLTTGCQTFTRAEHLRFASSSSRKHHDIRIANTGILGDTN